MTSTGSFREYCEQTSLHGWFYTATSDRKIWRLLWLLIVLTSMGVASVFVYKASEEFRKATVVTTIHSTTEPLSEVFFPAVTVCNINQVCGLINKQANKQTRYVSRVSLCTVFGMNVTSLQIRKSFFNDLGINNNVSVVDLLYQQFYTGSRNEPRQHEKSFMRNLFRYGILYFEAL